MLWLSLVHDQRVLMTKHYPLPVTQNTLRLLQKAWTSYHSVTLAGVSAIAKLNFKQHPKSLTMKNQKKEQGRYVVVFNCQAVSKNACPKRYAS